MTRDGQPMGCSDSGPPETYCERTLSRAHDVVQAIRAHVSNIVQDGCAAKEEMKSMVARCVPDRMMFEMTWTKWTYRSRA